jgi:phosphonate C-P lyase system protein PhnH
MTDSVTERHQAFRALLAALAMPGTRHQVPGDDALALILDSLYPDVESALQTRKITLAASAISPAVIESADRGKEIQPELGATIFLQIDEQTPWTDATLSGPGVNVSHDVKVPFAPETIAARARACAAFPLGIDIVVIDRNASVMAFPRTTRIEH